MGFNSNGFNGLNGLAGKAIQYLILTRPLEWSKSLGNMLIAALVASNFVNFDLGVFLLGFIAVGPLLWGGLYALNDWSDHLADRKHKVKNRRPIPSGKISPNSALAFSVTLIAGAFLMGIFLLNNWLFTLCIFLMLVNQKLYTLKPIHLKSRPVLDLVSGSLVNPLLRFYAGWVLFAFAFNAPPLLLLFILGLQFGGYTLYRLASKDHEKKLGYKSSIVVFPESAVKLIAYLGVLVGVVAYIASTLYGVLPFKFISLAVLSLLAVPLYLKALRDPKKMDMKKIYRTLYLHLILFIAGFIALGFWL